MTATIREEIVSAGLVEAVSARSRVRYDNVSHIAYKEPDGRATLACTAAAGIATTSNGNWCPQCVGWFRKSQAADAA